LLYYQPKSKTVHVFLEGNDDFSFYTNYVTNIIINSLPEDKHYNYYPHLCGNKKGVYDLYQLVNPRLKNKSRGLFFVDKDFSEILGEIYPSDENIYVTDYYSIENFLVSEDVLKRVLQEIYHINSLELDDLLAKSSLDKNSILYIFMQELKTFHLLMIPIIAWIICLKRLNIKPNLNNVKLDKIFHLDETQLTIDKINNSGYLSRFKYLEAVFNVSTPPGVWLQILNEARKLRIIFDQNPKIYIRGKYELWFLICFLNKLEKRLRDELKVHKKAFSVKTQITNENAIEILGTRVYCPESLNRFLENHRDNIINSIEIDI
jgi:hypothetical protein